MSAHAWKFTREKEWECLFLFKLNFLTNKVVQDWIKIVESRAEIKLIVIFFRSESMTFLS